MGDDGQQQYATNSYRYITVNRSNDDGDVDDGEKLPNMKMVDESVMIIKTILLGIIKLMMLTLLPWFIKQLAWYASCELMMVGIYLKT